MASNFASRPTPDDLAKQSVGPSDGAIQSPSTSLVIFIRLKRLTLAITNALQKLNLFQIPATAPICFEFRRELRGRRRRRCIIIHMRFPVKRGLFQSRQLFPLSRARRGGGELSQLQFWFASARSVNGQRLRSRGWYR